MNNDKIIEGNIEITRFMGGYLSDHPELNGVKVWHGYDPVEGRLNLPTTLTFHSDWNLLMPIVNKITSSDEYYKYREYNSSLLSDGRIHINTKYISDTWEQVVEFVKWYNQQNK